MTVQASQCTLLMIPTKGRKMNMQQSRRSPLLEERTPSGIYYVLKEDSLIEDRMFPLMGMSGIDLTMSIVDENEVTRCKMKLTKDMIHSNTYENILLENDQGSIFDINYSASVVQDFIMDVEDTLFFVSTEQLKNTRYLSTCLKSKTVLTDVKKLYEKHIQLFNT
jgi:hypothetical protein